jgi:hypothetical protein
VQSYAVDHNDTYPAAADSGTLASYIDNWPKNPWLTTPMETNKTTEGNCNYTVTSTAFSLVGYGTGGNPVITVP